MKDPRLIRTSGGGWLLGFRCALEIATAAIHEGKVVEKKHDESSTDSD